MTQEQREQKLAELARKIAEKGISKLLKGQEEKK